MQNRQNDLEWCPAEPATAPGARSDATCTKNAGETAATPVLMAGAWVRAPSIARTGVSRGLCEAAASAAADTACRGRGSATKTRVRPCFGRLSMVAGTGCARWLWQVVAPCSAEVLPMVSTGAGRALGHMLPALARERWPFCVLHDSCHAATADPPRLPPIGSGRRTGGSRRHLRPSYLPLVVTAWLQRVLGRAAWACLCQLACQWLKRPSPTHDPKMLLS